MHVISSQLFEPRLRFLKKNYICFVIFNNIRSSKMMIIPKHIVKDNRDLSSVVKELGNVLHNDRSRK